MRSLLSLAAVLFVFDAALFVLPAAGRAPNEVRILLVVVDGNQPVPRSLRHYEKGGATNVAWTDVSTIHHFAFERDTSLARLFDEMSYGVTTIAGDTLSVSLPYDASDLTSAQWTQLALAKAESRGFDRSDYDRSSPSCRICQRAQLPGASPVARPVGVRS